MQPLNKAHWSPAAACASGLHSDTAAADPAVGLHRPHHGAQLPQPGAFRGFCEILEGLLLQLVQ